MSIRVLVNELPNRALALATETHILFFRHAHTPPKALSRDDSSTSLPLPNTNTSRSSNTPRCMAEFAEKRTDSLKGYRTLTTAKGTLGLITLNNDVFICVVTGSAEVATVRPGETVQKISAVEFYCLNKSDYDQAHGFGPNPYPGQGFAADEGSYEQGDTTAEHPFHALRKLLSAGNFFYSFNFDLTRRLQDRADGSELVDISSLDEGLLWNSYMINPLLSFRARLSTHERHALDRSGMLTSVIRGFAQTLTIPSSSVPIRRKVSNYPATLTVISRLSARRAGTRFNSRGLDDNGNVANFVETETIFWSPTGLCFSYVQVRGSVPIFWESSSSLIPGQQKIQITRSPEATQPSFDKHFEGMEKAYGAIHIVNLLSDLKPGEQELSMHYREHTARSPLRRRNSSDTSSNHDLLRVTEFDFHEYARQAGGYEGAQRIRPFIDGSAEGFVYFLSEDIEETVTVQGRSQSIKRPVVVMQQNGVFRVNCLDCLDRTNLVQGIISQMALEIFLSHRDESRGSPDFWLRHSSLWADNGDALSKIYAGTGALKSSFTRHGKMSLGGIMSDARKSAARLYVNHFEDRNRQNTVDLLLGRLVGQGEVELFDPINDYVMEQIQKRRDEYESLESVRFWVGTYNLNGKSFGGDAADLRKWLPNPSGSDSQFEAVVVGFQEIVDLSPQQIMSTDPGQRIVWETTVKECLNGRGFLDEKTRSAHDAKQEREDDYVLLRSGQLVGAALMVFVKSSVLGKIRNVEGAIKKTGMSGMAGNKGAVAIRMDVEGTSVCFVTAHLAAGFGNYEERNRDYTTITGGLRFQRDRSIEDHEIVVWAGDFNYRIGLSYDKARSLVGIAQKGLPSFKSSRKLAGSTKGPESDSRAVREAEEALEKLYENDQLNIQMVVGHTFPFYREGKIRFLPTYKFDLGVDEYDSSEKARIPAWTDRILWKVKPFGPTNTMNAAAHAGASGMKQLDYGSVMGVRFSDHRPVYASFEVDVRKIDEQAKSMLIKKMYDKRVNDLRNGSGTEDDSEFSEEEAENLMGYQSIQDGLPPASSERRKWWLDGDKPVRSRLGPPREGMVLNEGRDGNPWKDGGEDEWIEVDKSESMARYGGIVNGVGRKPEPPPPRRSQTVSQSQQRKMVVPAWDGPTTSAADRPRNADFKNMSGPRSPSFRDGGLSRAASVASTATTASMMTANSEVKKTPPRKPVKPASLSTTSSQTAVPQVGSFPGPAKTTQHSSDSGEHVLETHHASGTEHPPPLPQRTNTVGSVSSVTPSESKRVPPPVQPRGVARLQQRPREGSVSSVSSSRSIESTSSAQGGSRPSLPPRPPIQSSNHNAALMDEDLGDEGDEQSTKWKPLTPETRH